MSQRTLSLLFFICLLSLVACQSDAPPPVLPNMLVEVDGEVEVVRQGGSAIPVPIALGAELQLGDRLYLKSGQAAIFCGNETLWASSPISLPLGKHFKLTCQEGRVKSKSKAAGISIVRRPESRASQHIPIALSPRSGFVLNDRPTLRWHLLPGVETYTVTLKSDDGKTRPPVSVSGNVLSYPKQWPSLQAGGAGYRLRVEGEVPRSDEGEIKEGFSLLAPDQAEQVRDLSQRLRERDLSHLSETLLLAKLYLSDEYKLRSEAAELLLALPDGDQVVAVQHLLGETYLEMGRPDEATAAYQQALTLAQNASLPEEQAAAHLRLGLLACAQTDHENARTHWQEALKLYDQMESPKDEVEALLAEVESKCSP